MSQTTIIFTVVGVALIVGLLLIIYYDKTKSLDIVGGFLSLLLNLIGIGVLISTVVCVFCVVFAVGKGVAVGINKQLHEPVGIISDDEGDYSSGNNVHHVNPHSVNGYYRSNGVYVDGYWRGGSDGYMQSNPDENPYNNLK